MYVCMYVRMYVCTYVRMYVCTYVRMHACMYADKSLTVSKLTSVSNQPFAQLYDTDTDSQTIVSWLISTVCTDYSNFHFQPFQITFLTGLLIHAFTFSRKRSMPCLVSTRQCTFIPNVS